MTLPSARFLVLLVLACWCAIEPIQAQDVVPTYQFGYLVSTSEGQKIGLVNPILAYRNPAQPAPPSDFSYFQPSPFSGDPVQLIAQAVIEPNYLSPDGQWLALTMLDEATNEKVLMIWNIKTNETREIRRRESAAFDDLTAVAWSPDSQSLAYSLTDTDISYPPYITVSVHDLERDTPFVVFDDPTVGWYQTFALIWSPDSQFLTLAIRGCPSGDCNKGAYIFQQYAMAGVRASSEIEEAASSTDISPLDIGIPCDFLWSPNNRYLAFKNGCRASLEQSVWFYDVYLWDTVLNEIKQVTHLGNAYPNPTLEDVEPYVNSYSLLWSDPETLMVSYRQLSGGTEFDTTRFGTGTLLYHADADTSTTMPDGEFMRFAQSSDGRLAFVKRTSTLEESGEPGYGTLIEEYDGVHIGRLAGDTIIDYTEAIACNLVWSPDGRFLAYATGERCSQITGYTFVDTQKNIGKHFDFPQGVSVKPLGWMATPSMGQRG